MSETLPAAQGGEDALTNSLDPDVPGLTFDAATRVLSGTSTTPGVYQMTYTATDPATDAHAPMVDGERRILVSDWGEEAAPDQPYGAYWRDMALQ